MNSRQYVLLWSKSQNALHIETLSCLVEKNIKALGMNKSLTDYHVISVGSRKDCEHIADQVRPRHVSRVVIDQTIFDR